MIFHTNINGTTSGSGSVQVTVPTCDPPAVTVSSVSAHVTDDGAAWAMLVAMGIMTLGAVVFVVARKR